MSSCTIQLKRSDLVKLQKPWAIHKVANPANPHVLFTYKVNGNTITIYQNLRLLIQGNQAEEVQNQILKLLNYQVNNTSHSASSQPLHNYVGCDEVGVSDYFGGMITCAVYITEQQVHTLKALGVKDSKMLDDASIISIAKQLVKQVAFSYTSCNAHEYNALVDKYHNTHVVKTLMHDQTIKSLIKQYKLVDPVVVMDEYVSKTNYFNYFKKFNLGEPYPIKIFETHAENKYLAVAAASIIARMYFLEQVDRLNHQLRTKLPLGAANPNIVVQAKKIYKVGGMKQLAQFVKIGFSITNKVVK